MTQLKVTILVENTVGAPLGLLGEWGLSMLLDFGDGRILFDVGEQGSLMTNGQLLHQDLNQIDALVLSHGHYDHTGGLLKFLQFKGALPIHAHPNIFAPHFAKGPQGQRDRYIGIPYGQKHLESLGAHFHWHREPCELRPGLWLSGEIPRTTPFEAVDAHLIELEGEKAVPDKLPDDLSLFYVTEKGLIILLGCAHAGLVNIAEHAKKVTGESRVRAIIGGTHLGPAAPEQQRQTIDYLRGLDLECLAPNHCTGPVMQSKLAAEFPAVFRWATAGSSLEF